MGQWIVFAVQVTLSLITLTVAVLSFVWVRSSAREGRETKRLLENLSALFRKMYEPTLPGRSALVTGAPTNEQQGSTSSAPVELESMTEPQRRQALTVEMVRPSGFPRSAGSIRCDADDAPMPSTVEIPPPLAVKVGAEIIELDAEIVARIEALREDVNAGETAGDLLQRLIEADFTRAEQGDRISGEVSRVSGDRGLDESNQAMHEEGRSTEQTPDDMIPPTTPTKPTR